MCGPPNRNGWNLPRHGVRCQRPEDAANGSASRVWPAAKPWTCPAGALAHRQPLALPRPADLEAASGWRANWPCVGLDQSAPFLRGRLQTACALTADGVGHHPPCSAPPSGFDLQTLAAARRAPGVLTGLGWIAALRGPGRASWRERQAIATSEEKKPPSPGGARGWPPPGVPAPPGSGPRRRWPNLGGSLPGQPAGAKKKKGGKAPPHQPPAPRLKAGGLPLRAFHLGLRDDGVHLGIEHQSRPFAGIFFAGD